MPGIDRTILPQLTANRAGTLHQLRAASNATFLEVARSIGEQRKRLAVQAAASAPPAVAQAIAGLDAVALASGKLDAAVAKALDTARADEATRTKVLDALRE